MKDIFSLSGKTILITGCTSGIGKATALLLDALDARMVLTGRNQDKLDALLAGMEHPERHRLSLFDREGERSVTDWVTEIETFDGVVFSAGILERTPTGFLSVAGLSRLMRVNFEKPMEMVQVLSRQKKIRKGGSIVFVSSLSGIHASTPGLVGYTASKGALSAAVRPLALDLAPRGIRVNAVCPGMVRTEMLVNDKSISEYQLDVYEKQRYPLGFGRPEDVAPTIAFLLSDGATWITGSNLVLDGGASAK